MEEARGRWTDYGKEATDKQAYVLVPFLSPLELGSPKLERKVGRC